MLVRKVTRAVPWLVAGAFALSIAVHSHAAETPRYDVLIRGGAIYDGTGEKSFVGDVAVAGDRIVFVGRKAVGGARHLIDARGLAVAPGFINMLSWSTESLIVDGRGQSELRQGITLEVMGEGWSMGPLNEPMKRLAEQRQGDIKFKITWTTLGEYLDTLQKRGISLNVASFVGATTVRIHELGEGNVQPNAAQLNRMRSLVRKAMEEGALGLGSSLIYAPANYARTPELAALAEEAGACGGIYISHIRSEGDKIEAALDELFAISRTAKVPAEIYHLKAAGKSNWR
ncbi:MAG: hypothetical protein ACT4OG_01640 [Alphaproteobacteria bacterium]